MVILVWELERRFLPERLILAVCCDSEQISSISRRYQLFQLSSAVHKLLDLIPIDTLNIQLKRARRAMNTATWSCFKTGKLRGGM
jgi:hypothetical protein